MAKFLCVLFALAVVAFAAPIAPESRGYDFFVAFGFNYQTAVNTLYISTDLAQTVVVSTKTSTVATLTLAAKSTQSVDVSAYIIPSLNTVGTAGLRVRSTSNTSFTLIGLNSRPASSDAFLGFPVNILGTNYMAASYNGLSSFPGYLYVVAPEDGTTVTISGPRTLSGLSSGTVTHTLQSYGTVAVGITNNGDITGFTVNSNKPVAVFGGSQCSNIPVGVAACNLLVEQIPPTNTWASDFVTVPLATRTAGDVFRVVSNTTGTVVTVNGNNVATLAFGAWYEFSSSVTNVIHTSFPALVMQYSKGTSADGKSSDPFQIWVPPVNQYSANYYISTPTGTGWTSRYVNIIIESGTQSGLTLDNAPISATWSPVTGSTYVYAQILISGGSHQVSHSSPIQQFNVIVYGYGSADGFGYIGGSRFAPLQDPCTVTSTIPGDGLDNDCDQRVDEEIRNGLDDDNDGLIDEDLTVDTCCYGNTQNPVLSVSSIAPVTIGCGDALPAVPSVTATVACANITTFAITPTVSTTPGSSCTYASVTRTFTVVDSCGRSVSVQQVITITQSVCGNGNVEAGEQCDGGSCCTSSCTFRSSATTCRASNGVCDVAETCTGSSASCPADSFQSSSVTCRASNGICDVAETCTGSSASCPADSFQSSSVTCRASNGVCDVAETCTGSSSSCPADSFVSSSVTCRASNGVCDVAETCTGSSASCPADSFQSSATTCRASNGVCDVAETCTGSSSSCPADSFQSSSVTCRGSNGVCDVAETCTGSSASCPVDSFQSSSVTCRASNGVCDVAETCTGSSASCPADSFASSAVTCRASNGICDVAEQCTGNDASCPANSFQSSSVTCRASNGVCDVAETCTGSSESCPADSFAASSVTCRGSNGDCDVAEQCTGSDAACPADSFLSSATTCRSSAGICDVAETCTGSDAVCPADAVAPSSQTCRAAAGPCDVAESCTGNAVTCPFDAFASSTTVCRAAIGPCDVSESCTGSNAACPSDVSGSFETACAGLGLDFGNGPYSFLNYDVISFQDIVGPTGAIDGRAAAKNNVLVGTSYFGGYSVGYYVHATGSDQVLPFSLVAGHNVTFGGGAVYPDGIHNSPRENIFVGSGHITGQADLVERATGNCSGADGCLDSYFNAVQACYGGYQTAWAAQVSNVNKNIEWSGLYLDCADPTSAVQQYYLTLTPSEMTQYTWISMSNCNANARWIITVPGTSDVTFTAGTFPAQANAVVYNIVGSGRTVNVQNIYLQGHVVAPFNTVNQPSGNIVGKVIAANIPATLNINRAGSGCFTPQ